MSNLIPLLNAGLPIEIAKIINRYRLTNFKHQITEFNHEYRPIFYLKQYVIPDNILHHYVINHTPSFWSLPYSFSLSYYRFVKYGIYVLCIVNGIVITDNVKFDRFPIDFI
jgi:hypothetical protein